MQDQSNGNGVLDDSEIELALSIVTDRNATSKAVRDAALALDGALQAARQLQVPHDETLLLQIHVIVAERSNEVAMVVALLRLCSTLLLLQIVELKDAIEGGMVATIAELMSEHPSDADIRAACLQLGSIVCYAPEFCSLAEEANLPRDVLQALRQQTSRESDLEGLAILEVMLETTSLRESHDVAEVVIECVRSHYDLSICQSGACILASLSIMPAQLEAIAAHADLDFFAACIHTLGDRVVDAPALADMLTVLSRVVNNPTCRSVVAQEVQGSDITAERLISEMQELGQRLQADANGGDSSPEKEQAMALCSAVCRTIGELRSRPFGEDRLVHKDHDSAGDVLDEFQANLPDRFADQDSAERDQLDALDARRETVARRHQLGEGIFLQLQGDPNVGDRTLQQIRLLVELANSSHTELEQSLKRLDDWHTLQSRTMQQLQLLDDENKELRLKLTEAAMSIDQLSRELHTTRQQLELQQDQERELAQAVEDLQAAHEEAEEWQRRFTELQGNMQTTSSTTRSVLQANGTHDYRSARRIASEPSLASLSSTSHSNLAAIVPADIVALAVQVLEDVHLQLTRAQSLQQQSRSSTSPSSSSRLKQQQLPPASSSPAPAADDPRVVEFAGRAYQLFASLIPGSPGPSDQSATASVARVRRCLRLLCPTDGRNVVAGDIDVLITNAASQAQVKSKTAVNIEAFLRAVLQLLVKRHGLQNSNDLLNKAIEELCRVSNSPLLVRTSSEYTMPTPSPVNATSHSSWVDSIFDSTDAEDLEGVKSLLDKNSKILEQIFAAYAAPTSRSHSRLHPRPMDFQRLLVVAKDFELVPTILEKQQLSELYERICSQSQVSPQVGISAKGFMELLGVMALVSDWLRDVAGLHTATDRMLGVLKHMDLANAKQKVGSRQNSAVGSFHVR